jgi:hypothetical protein
MRVSGQKPSFHNDNDKFPSWPRCITYAPFYSLWIGPGLGLRGLLIPSEQPTAHRGRLPLVEVKLCDWGKPRVVAPVGKALR